MKQPKSLALGVGFISVCILVLLGAAIHRSTAARSTNQYQRTAQAPTFQIHNKTRFFQVSQTTSRESPIRSADDPPELSLRNDYDKTITAWIVSVNRLVTQADFICGEAEDDRGIPPGEMQVRKFSCGRPGNPNDLMSWQTFDVDVIAVVFDDGTGDGDQKSVQVILNLRLQTKKLLTRIVELLSAALDSPGIDDKAQFEDLKTEISSIDSPLGPRKEQALRELDEGNLSSPRERIRRLKQQYESCISRL